MTAITEPLNSSVLAQASAIAELFAGWGADTFATGGYPHREMNTLRKEGFLATTLPGRELDGSEPTTAKLLQLLKLIGRGNLSVGRIYEGHVNAIELIRLYGRPEQQERWYADVEAGHLFGVWNTEMRDGVHLHGESTPAQGVQLGLLKGSKSFCSGSTHVTRPVITGTYHGADGAKLGWQMLIPHLDELELPVDVSFWTPLGMQNSVSHKIDFTGTPFYEGQLLGSADDYGIQPHFSGGAIRFAAVHLGGAEALVDATVAFLRRVGRTDDCHQRTRLGKMAILVESGNQWLQRAGHIHDTCQDAERVITMANMTRTAIADICTECLQLAERSVGSRGLMHPGALARLHTDLSMYLRQPAPDATLEQVGDYHLSRDQPVHKTWINDRLIYRS